MSTRDWSSDLQIYFFYICVRYRDTHIYIYTHAYDIETHIYIYTQIRTFQRVYIYICTQHVYMYGYTYLYLVLYLTETCFQSQIHLHIIMTIYSYVYIYVCIWHIVDIFTYSNIYMRLRTNILYIHVFSVDFWVRKNIENVWTFKLPKDCLERGIAVLKRNVGVALWLHHDVPVQASTRNIHLLSHASLRIAFAR